MNRIPSVAAMLAALAALALAAPAAADKPATSQPSKSRIHVQVPEVDFDMDLDLDIDVAKHMHSYGSALCAGGSPSGPPAATGGEGKPAAVAAKGPVKFVIELRSADIHIAAGGDKVAVSAKDCGKDEIKLYATGKDTYEAGFDEEGSCEGPVTVQLPPGSAVDIEEMQGDISSSGTLGNVRIESVSGSIKLDGAADVDIEAVEGDVGIAKASGKIRIQTVNGDSKIGTLGSAPDMTFRSTSGSLSWAGTCGKGCRLRIEVYSGDVGLAFDPASSFEISFANQSGELNDKLGLANLDKRKNIAGIMRAKGTFGKAEGSVGVKMFSGDLTVAKR